MTEIIAWRCGGWISIEREMRVSDAGTLERGDQAVELCDVAHRSDTHSIHPAARDLIIAHENLAVAAAAQFFRHALRIRRVGEGAGLDEQRGARSSGTRSLCRHRRRRR